VATASGFCSRKSGATLTALAVLKQLWMPAMIQSTLLPEFLGYINGQFTADASAETFAVRNPANGELLANVPDMGFAQTSAAIEAASRALRLDVSLNHRRQWLKQIVGLLLQNKQELARIITLEQGKPLKESLTEVEYSAGFFRFCSEQIEHLQPRELSEHPRNMRWTVHHRPAGVVALITPWNFPLAMLAKKLAPAIATGCAAVIKPAELTPLTCIALFTLLRQLDLPAGRLNLVIGSPEPISDAIFAHPAVRLVSLTGSTAVGKLLIQKSAAGVKRLALELGGNAPYIVMDDADIDAAADALMANKFRCAGQTCVCANRIYVQQGIGSKFNEAIAQRVAKLHVGNGMEPQTDIGPLINREGFQKVDHHVRDAVKRGAKRIVGSDRPAPTEVWGAFYSPTVLTNTTGDMLLSKEETFGPVVALETFDAESQAIELANSTAYGLASYLFTGDLARARRMAAQLRFGHIGFNSGTGPTPEAPFGGMKQSGYGREGGLEGLSEFTEPQTVVEP
jgi:succinate-semialdehyde dehydrogenase/glutarate-semialdehyde dehydrogenase